MNVHVINSQTPDPEKSGTCAPLTHLQRAVGTAEISFKRRGHQTVLDHLYQNGCCKVRFPKEEGFAQAVLLNTSGGLTDHDKMEVTAHWKADTRALVTTQAAEKIYKSRGAPAQIINTLKVDEDACGFWVPQETILFDRGQVHRRLSADIAKNGSLLALESLVFGRTAMGEKTEIGCVKDTWRMFYDGRLVFADGLSLDGDIQASLSSPALLNGAIASATLVYVGDDVEEVGHTLSPLMGDMKSFAGFSIQGPVLVMRLLATESDFMRKDIAHICAKILSCLDRDKEFKDADILPRVWSC